MKKILLVSFLLFGILLLISFNCFSQNKLLNPETTNTMQTTDTGYIPSPLIINAGYDIIRPKAIVDTFSFKYNFRLGDTLIYFVMSKDSITIDYGPPLFRLRTEKIMLTCDSITSSGHFIIKQELIDFKSKESYLSERNVDRNTNPWLNVPVYIEIDTMGIRYNQYNYDTLTLAMSPAGAFRPFILLQLNAKDSINYKPVKQSWMVVDSNPIFENGMPAPAFRYSLYYRIIGMDDSLGLGMLLRMTFSMTSQSSHKVNTDDVKMLTTSINNAGGEIHWDTTNWIPKYYIHTVEQRLTIEDKINNYKSPGFHYIYSTFILDKFISGKDKK